MNKYRLICHYCGAITITACPEEVVWELCPGCQLHRWDNYDLMMAEVMIRKERTTERTTGMMTC